MSRKMPGRTLSRGRTIEAGAAAVQPRCQGLAVGVWGFQTTYLYAAWQLRFASPRACFARASGADLLALGFQKLPHRNMMAIGGNGLHGSGYAPRLGPQSAGRPALIVFPAEQARPWLCAISASIFCR
jgi:hypothetical protein